MFFQVMMRFLRGMAGTGRALLIGSGLCVVGAIAFSAGAMAFVTTGFALGIAGLVFTAIGRSVRGLAFLTPELRTEGLRGMATVVSVGDTGVTVNNDPVAIIALDVSLPGTSLYRVEVRQLVSRMAVGALTPGSQLPVVVDPDDLTQVVVDWEGEAPPAVTDAPAGIPGARVGSAAALLASGIRGIAVVTAMEDLGDISELGLQTSDADGADDRVFRITLDVKLPGREVYPATIGHRVPQDLVGRVGPGTEVAVAVGRDDDQEVAIDWEGAASG